MKKIISISILIIAVFWISHYSVKKTEQNECRQWAKDAQIYKDYYLADWQKQQCENLGIKVEIPKTAEVGIAAAIDEGMASWYDYGLPGYPDYSKTHDTGASRKYKKGTTVNVCSITLVYEESRCVEIIINDYGPELEKHPDRIIDLSSSAFGKLFPLEQGLGEVSVSELTKNYESK